MSQAATSVSCLTVLSSLEEQYDVGLGFRARGTGSWRVDEPDGAEWVVVSVLGAAGGDEGGGGGVGSGGGSRIRSGVGGTWMLVHGSEVVRGSGGRRAILSFLDGSVAGVPGCARSSASPAEPGQAWQSTRRMSVAKLLQARHPPSSSVESSTWRSRGRREAGCLRGPGLP